MDYLNFDINVSEVEGETHLVQAQSPHWGQVAATAAIDVSEAGMSSLLAEVDSDQTCKENLHTLGVRLFRWLFPSDVSDLFMISIGHAEALGMGLRIRLRLASPALRAVPWEYAQFTFGGHPRFLGAEVLTPLTRHLDVFTPSRPLAVSPPLRVLVVVPEGTGLDVGRELGKLEEAFEPLESFIEVSHEDKPTLERLGKRLRMTKPHVLHFIGHGEFKGGHGYLVINDDSGGPRPVTDEQLSTVFANAPSFRLAVLNACEGAASDQRSKDLSGVAQHLVAAGIPAVLAHRYPILDEYAIRFASEFYSSLVASPETGMVEAAVARARNQLNAEWPDKRIVGASVLYVRSSGPLFRIERPDKANLAALEAELRLADLDLDLARRRLSGEPESELHRLRLADAEAEVERLTAALGLVRRQQAQAAGVG